MSVFKFRWYCFICPDCQETGWFKWLEIHATNKNAVAVGLCPNNHQHEMRPDADALGIWGTAEVTPPEWYVRRFLLLTRRDYDPSDESLANTRAFLSSRHVAGDSGRRDVTDALNHWRSEAPNCIFDIAEDTLEKNGIRVWVYCPFCGAERFFDVFPPFMYSDVLEYAVAHNSCHESKKAE